MPRKGQVPGGRQRRKGRGLTQVVLLVWAPRFATGTLATSRCLIYSSHQPHEIRIIILDTEMQEPQRTELAQSCVESTSSTLILEKEVSWNRCPGSLRKQVKSPEPVGSLISTC